MLPLNRSLLHSLIYRQTSRKRPNKLPRFSGRLRELTHRGSLPRIGPGTSENWGGIHYMHFLSYDMRSFMFSTKRTSHYLRSVVQTTTGYMIEIKPCLKWMPKGKSLKLFSKKVVAVSY